MVSNKKLSLLTIFNLWNMENLWFKSYWLKELIVFKDTMITYYWTKLYSIDEPISAWATPRMKSSVAWVSYLVSEWRGLSRLVVVAGAAWCAVRTVHVGRAGRGRGRRGRIPAVTSRPPSAPDIHLARSALARTVPRLSLYLPLLLLQLFIYAQKLNITVSAGTDRWFSELAPRTIQRFSTPIENKRLGIRSGH